MNNFTEGDWRVLDQRELPGHIYDYAIVDDAGWYIANVENCNNKEDEANAILIAKAPRMYNLLERILRFQRENYGDAMSTHLGLALIANDIYKLLEEEDLWENVTAECRCCGITSHMEEEWQNLCEDCFRKLEDLKKNIKDDTIVCARCGTPVLPSVVTGYVYFCAEHDEDLYTIETCKYSEFKKED